jgi:hypothetical protein
MEHINVQQVDVQDALFDEIEHIYAPRSNPVFQLVPPTFSQHIQYIYSAINEPEVTDTTFWDVYSRILLEFQQLAEIDLNAVENEFKTERESVFEGNIDLIPHHDVQNTQQISSDDDGLWADDEDMCDYALFSDEEDEVDKAETANTAYFTDEESDNSAEDSHAVEELLVGLV